MYLSLLSSQTWGKHLHNHTSRTTYDFHGRTGPACPWHCHWMIATLIKIYRAKLLGKKSKTQSLFLAPNCFLPWYKLSFSRAVFENNIAFSYSQIFSSFWARQGENQQTVSRDLGTPVFFMTTFRLTLCQTGLQSGQRELLKRTQTGYYPLLVHSAIS